MKTKLLRVVLFASIPFLLSFNQNREYRNFNTSLLSEKCDNQVGSLEFLRKFKGKYPYEVKLLDNPILQKRLKILLGDRFTFLKKTWSVETPMKINDNIFKASACQAHNCGYTNFIIVADLNKNMLYVGIKEQKQVKVYSEDGSTSEVISEWSKSDY